jgi:hypothetical protein
MILLGDEAQVEAQFRPSRDSDNLDARQVYGMAPSILGAQKSFCTHRMEQLSDVGHVKSCFSLFGDSVSVCAR